MTELGLASPKGCEFSTRCALAGASVLDGEQAACSLDTGRGVDCGPVLARVWYAENSWLFDALDKKQPIVGEAFFNYPTGLSDEAVEANGGYAGLTVVPLRANHGPWEKLKVRRADLILGLYMSGFPEDAKRETDNSESNRILNRVGILVASLAGAMRNLFGFSPLCLRLCFPRASPACRSGRRRWSGHRLAGRDSVFL